MEGVENRTVENVAEQTNEAESSRQPLQCFHLRI